MPEGPYIYNITVASGGYIMAIKFAEIFGGITQPGQRIFDVGAEGKPLLDNLDLYEKDGLDAYDWTGAVDDGGLTPEFPKEAAQDVMVSAMAVQAAGSIAPSGSATLALNAGGLINASTYTAGKAIQLTNTGQKDIASVTFDLSTNHLKNVLFDPAGTAGDTDAKNLKVDSSGNTGAIQPSSSDYSIFANARSGGYEKMTVSFNSAVASGFNPGETVKLSVDIDPTSIKGSGINGDAGSISGAELVGSTVTITYTDGSTQTTQIFGDGTQGGGQASWSATEAAAPILSVAGQSSGKVAVATDTQTVLVTGAPNATVKVQMLTGGMGNKVQPTDIFDANKAIAIEFRTLLLDSSGHGSFQFKLPPHNPVYLSAAIDQNGAAGTGLVSHGLVVAVGGGAADTSAPSATGVAADITAAVASHSILVV
ncbi:hypothetical protein CLG96_14825, partial [Sphingomonas oleivorans]